MNKFTTEIKNELLMVKDFSNLEEIKRMNLESITLGELELSEDLVTTIKSKWSEAGLFKTNEADYKCYRNYVLDIIIKYTKYRSELKQSLNLCMNKFNRNDWDIDMHNEEGHDGFIYGKYIEWDEFREIHKDELLVAIGIDLGEVSNLEELSSFMFQEDYENFTLDIEESGSKICYSDNEVITALFNFYGVPSGTEYTYDSHDSYRCSFEEYQYYASNPEYYKKYKQSMEKIAEKIEESSDDMTKKALLLASFVTTEEVYKIVLTRKVESISPVIESLKYVIVEKLNTRNGRDNLYKAVFELNAPKQDWIELRNELAHSIATPTIENKDIIYRNRKKVEKKYSITSLVQMQLNFCEKLIENMDHNEY